MQDKQPNLLTRDDTFLGICEGLGEDLGISPNLFRVAMIPTLFFFPVETIAVYAAAGLLVLGTRLVFPHPPQIIATASPAAGDVAEPGQPLAEPVDFEEFDTVTAVAA